MLIDQFFICISLHVVVVVICHDVEGGLDISRERERWISTISCVPAHAHGPWHGWNVCSSLVVVFELCGSGSGRLCPPLGWC